MPPGIADGILFREGIPGLVVQHLTDGHRRGDPREFREGDRELGLAAALVQQALRRPEESNVAGRPEDAVELCAAAVHGGLHLLGDGVYREGAVPVGDACEGVPVVHPDGEGGGVLPVIGDLPQPLHALVRGHEVPGEGEAEPLRCIGVDGCTDEPAAVLSHPHDVVPGHRIGPDGEIGLPLAVVEVVEEDELPVPEGRDGLLKHGRPPRSPSHHRRGRVVS